MLWRTKWKKRCNSHVSNNAHLGSWVLEMVEPPFHASFQVRPLYYSTTKPLSAGNNTPPPPPVVTSDFASANISVRSPQNIHVFHKNLICTGSNYPEGIWFILKTKNNCRHCVLAPFSKLSFPPDSVDKDRVLHNYTLDFCNRLYLASIRQDRLYPWQYLSMLFVFRAIAFQINLFFWILMRISWWIVW